MYLHLMRADGRERGLRKKIGGRALEPFIGLDYTSIPINCVDHVNYNLFFLTLCAITFI